MNQRRLRLAAFALWILALCMVWGPQAQSQAAPETDASGDALQAEVSNSPSGASSSSQSSSTSPSTPPLEEVVASAGVGGGFFEPRCRDGAVLEASEFSHVTSGLVDARARGALVLDTGGLLARHGLMRFAAAEAPEAAAAMVQGVGYHALAFSEADLSDSRELLLARATALRDAGVPMVATNLVCSGEATALCDTMLTGPDGVPFFDSGSGTRDVAVLSFVVPSALSRVAPDRRTGLRLLPLRASLETAVRAARRRGARLVIAMIDSGSGASAVAAITVVTEGLADEDKPDLVLSAEGGDEILFARPASIRPGIVAPPPAGATSVGVRRHDGRYDLWASPVTSAEAVAEPVARFEEFIGASYCERFGQPFEGAAIERDMDAAALADLAASAMRESADADFALLNRDVINRRWSRPAGTVLAGADVHVAVDFDEALMTAVVPASWVREAARRVANHEGLVAPALVATAPGTDDESIQLGGRSIDSVAEYRVVTIRYLALGGEGLLPGGAEWELLDTSVRGVIEDYLDEPRDEDPRDAVPDPGDSLEWRVYTDFGLNFSGNAVRDESAYAEGPLTNDSQVLFGVTGRVRWMAVNRVAAWQNDLTANYSLANSAGSAGFQEGGDQIVYRTDGQWRGLRKQYDEIYVPDFLVEGLLRTEFTRSEEDDSSHFLNFRLTAGPQWRLLENLSLRAVGGLEVVEALDDELRQVNPGVGAQLTLSGLTLLSGDERSLTAAASIDYFASFSEQTRHLVQSTFDMTFSLASGIGLSFNVSLYGLKRSDANFSFALGTAANLHIAWNERWVAR